mgnify:FL=1
MSLSKQQFLENWYDFFQLNKHKFDKIFYENNYNSATCNSKLQKYGCPHRFSKMVSSGYSIIFKNLHELKKIYVSGFTLCSNEFRKTSGEKDEYAAVKNKGDGYHSFLDENKILAWLHNNNKLDASLCMLEDTADIVFKPNSYNTKPSKFIVDLVEKETL